MRRYVPIAMKAALVVLIYRDESGLSASSDMTRIRETLKRGEMGHWQDLFREISAANSFDKG